MTQAYSDPKRASEQQGYRCSEHTDCDHDGGWSEQDGVWTCDQCGRHVQWPSHPCNPERPCGEFEARS